jgi:hypothetical protein
MCIIRYWRLTPTICAGYCVLESKCLASQLILFSKGFTLSFCLNRRASLGLHEYSESRMCFTSLLDIQKQVLQQVSSQDDVDSAEVKKAEDDILTTEKWLKKLKKAEIDYKNRDKSIGKRISKGLFEGKDEIDVVKQKTSKEVLANVESTTKIDENETLSKIDTGNSISQVSVETGSDDNKSSQESRPLSLRGESVKSTASTPPVSIASSPRKSRGGVVHAHPVIEYIYTNQFYIYSAVFVASVAVGLSVF